MKRQAWRRAAEIRLQRFQSGSEPGDVLGSAPVDDIEIDRDMRRTMRRCCKSADDDELDTRSRQNGEQPLEVRHLDLTFTFESRTASANRSADIILAIRSLVLSFRFSRNRLRST